MVVTETQSSLLGIDPRLSAHQPGSDWPLAHASHVLLLIKNIFNKSVKFNIE